MSSKKKYPIEKYQDIGKILKKRLDLESEIVSIKFIVKGFSV